MEKRRNKKVDKERYERQKAFAGEKKPSMLRRCVGHDYMERQMYMVTMVTEGRRPLFGKVTGRDDAPAGTDDAPRMVLDKLGQRVVDCWNQITERHPQIETIALQMMPDHLHGILFVKERLPKPLGKVLLGFKQGCNKAYRELFPGLLPNTAAAPSVAVPSTAPSVAVPSVAVLQQQTKPASSDRAHGLLFARGYNDKLLLRQGQLQSWLDYLRDNPRRLVIKREHPDLFRVQRGLMVGGQQFSAIGNRFLLSRPLRVQVQCSRCLTDEQIVAGGAAPVHSIEELYSASDYLSIHIPALPSTIKSIGYDLVMRMPKGATLVNTARKEVIDEDGLFKALQERPDLKYVTDVMPDNYAAMVEAFGPRVFATPKKMGAQTAEANVNAGLAAARQIVDFFATGNRKFQVNK